MNWTKEQYEAFIAKGKKAADIVAGLQSILPEPPVRTPLVGVQKRAPSRRQRLAGRRKPVLRVGIVAVVNRLHDSDAIVSQEKGLRDAISRWFGLDDADDQI